MTITSSRDLRRSAVAPAPEPTASTAPRSHVTRALHLFMLLVVLHQLFGSLIVQRPKAGEAPLWPYWTHEYVGLVGICAMTLFWLWTLLRDPGETRLSKLFPWFSTKGWRGVIADLRSLFGDLAALRMPSLHLDDLAGAVHGLGLATASFMALSGATWYFQVKGSTFGRMAMSAHHLVADLMWAYVIAHVSLAVAHRLLGDDVFARMFWTRRAA